MASTAYCLYCFEVLAASLENRDALSLRQVEDLWDCYNGGNPIAEGGKDTENNDAEMTEDEDRDEQDDGESADLDDGVEDVSKDPVPTLLRPKDVSRLHMPSPASGASASSTPSTLSTASSSSALGESSKSSSKSSFFSFTRKPQPSPVEKEQRYPLFVTWNTISARGHKSLRGCIGTFEDQKLSTGLKDYALTSAFDDTRFSPITLAELPSLSNSITLLMNFTPCADPLDWDLETHGIRISFTHHNRRYSATYLPDVAVEQGWNKEETIVSLMRKSGWSGRSKDWNKVTDLKCVRYKGKKCSADYRTWKEWRDWVDMELKRR